MIAGIEHVYSGGHEDFLSYDEALEFAFNSVVQHALKADQEHFGEPRSISEVHKLPKEQQERWLKAAQDEIQSLVENGTFQLVQLPPGHKAIGSCWVFRIKCNADSSIERYKGRLIPKCFSQCLGFDYNETFAPTPKLGFDSSHSCACSPRGFGARVCGHFLCLSQWRAEGGGLHEAA